MNYYLNWKQKMFGDMPYLEINYFNENGDWSGRSYYLPTMQKTFHTYFALVMYASRPKKEVQNG